MASHTKEEIQMFLYDHIGLLFDVRTYEELGPARWGVWLDNVEVLQVPDRAFEAGTLVKHIPPQLSARHDDFQDRLRVLARLQRLKTLEDALAFEPFRMALLEKTRALPKEPPAALRSLDGIPPLSVARSVRDCVARVIWEASPLLLRQMQEVVGNEAK